MKNYLCYNENRYESILSSTNSGKDLLIENWCKEHIMSFDKRYFSISQDKRINYNGTRMPLFIVNVKSKEDFPEYIKFGNMKAMEVYIGEEGKFMSNDQYPTYCESICFSRKTQSENFDFLKKNRIVINSDKLDIGEGVKGIKSIFWTSNYDDILLKCRYSEFPLKDFQNIHLINDFGICTLDLKGSKAGTQFAQEITKIENENTDVFERQKKWREYICKTFPLIEGLATICFTRYDGRKFVEYKFNDIDTKTPMMYVI